MAYKAACDLRLKDWRSRAGYTEPLLHRPRLKVKAATA
jgi:malate synthase